MKAVILAGGMGTRISEETQVRPKPMIEIGGKPLLWHIMKTYSHHGINDFIVCLGYKGYMIKEYFANYFLHMSDVTFDIAKNAMEVHEKHGEPWRVTLLETGEHTQTGGRLARVARYLKDEAVFCFTYGDGIANVDIAASIAFHKTQGVAATVTAVVPAGRFGAMQLEGPRVRSFHEKPKGDGAVINGGFFVLNREVLGLIEGDAVAWEGPPLTGLARRGQLAAWQHSGFWHPVDTLRDRQYLESLWSEGKAPWKVWK